MGKGTRHKVADHHIKDMVGGTPFTVGGWSFTGYTLYNIHAYVEIGSRRGDIPETGHGQSDSLNTMALRLANLTRTELEFVNVKINHIHVRMRAYIIYNYITVGL